eukprot:3507196-Amphidinium_carterae.1
MLARSDLAGAAHVLRIDDLRKRESSPQDCLRFVLCSVPSPGHLRINTQIETVLADRYPLTQWNVRRLLASFHPHFGP